MKDKLMYYKQALNESDVHQTVDAIGLWKLNRKRQFQWKREEILG